MMFCVGLLFASIIMGLVEYFGDIAKEEERRRKERCLESFRELFNIVPQLLCENSIVSQVRLLNMRHLWSLEHILENVDFGATLSERILACGISEGEMQALKECYEDVLDNPAATETSDAVAEHINRLVDLRESAGLSFNVYDFLWNVTLLRGELDIRSFEIWRGVYFHDVPVQYVCVATAAKIVSLSLPLPSVEKLVIECLLDSNWFRIGQPSIPFDAVEILTRRIYDEKIQTHESDETALNRVARLTGQEAEVRRNIYRGLWNVARMNGEPTFKQKWFLREACVRMEMPVALFNENHLRVHGTFAMFSLAARMAKIDGNASPLKVDVASRLFDLLEIPEGEREPFKTAFNQTVHSPEGQEKIFEDANSVAQAKESFDEDTRGTLYGLLWDIACADGVLTVNEKATLQQLCGKLSIPNKLFDENYASHKYLVTEEASQESGQSWQQSSRSRREDGRRTSDAPRDDTLMKAYATLGCASNATERELREAYHKSAKLYHEDILRSSGASEDTIAFARQKMRLLNEAWERICKARGI